MRKYPILEIEDVIEPVLKRQSIPLADYAPEIAEQWCYRLNCGFGPERFSHGSGVKSWWTCPDCNRDYKAQINNRVVRGSNCPYCNSKLVCKENSLEVNYPEIAKEWHPKKNSKRKLCDVMFGSAKYAWWLCSQCGHSWRAVVVTRTRQEAGCPKCYERRLQKARERPKVRKRPKIVLSESNTEISRDWYEKWNFVPLSKSHPQLAKQWHPTKNGIWKPKDFTRGSEVYAWWKCDKDPSHHWLAQIYSRTAGRGCRICARRKTR